MASILRQIVASPRARHPEAGLDLCYVTEKIIATSGPSATYPQVAYRNPLRDLVRFLDEKHGAQWAIWEFRAEGTGYPDEEVYHRVRHYPWPDHHPPPFALIPLIMASMRNWLCEEAVDGRVVVVHCKAGKGRSGTVSCSYLISQEGWSPEDAMQRFTERRMRPGFGAGISIPSQRRWISYVERWTKGGKRYVERPVEVLELHVWGLRDGVKVAVEGYVDEGKTIKKFHTFHASEREIVRGQIRSDTGFADVAMEVLGRRKVDDRRLSRVQTDELLDKAGRKQEAEGESTGTTGGDVVFRPSSRVVLPSSDINIDVERRNKTRYGGFAMVTSVGHVWFNTFFEGNGPEQDAKADESGVFEIGWDAMDGIKGSSRKGTRAFDRMAVVWKAVHLDHRSSVVINEPEIGQGVSQAKPADWRGSGEGGAQRSSMPTLGLRPDSNESAEISRASSAHSTSKLDDTHGSEEELEGLRPSGPAGEDNLHSSPAPQQTQTSGSDETPIDSSKTITDQPLSHPPEEMNGRLSVPHVPTADLPGGKPEEELEDHQDHSIGHVSAYGSDDLIS